MDVFKTHGAFSWSELMTTDPAAAAGFYGKLFGWTIKESAAMGGYRTAHVGDGDQAGIGGLMAIPPEAQGMPPRWGVYVTVTNLEDTLAQARALGGTVCMAPMEIPNVGRMATLNDPQGATINVIQYSS